ncbi:hypothetical protein I79_022892 [Cricetulus griseus]|uniref:Uncharacterized protein n=1 Tax=Cricetulus griseus TaxID=10029 RepID=G3IGH7_CRIGR|nr:hypothetical protein I79_022892 [Cricetulus griseus]
MVACLVRAHTPPSPLSPHTQGDVFTLKNLGGIIPQGSQTHLPVTTTTILVILVVQKVSSKGSHGLDISGNNLIQVFKFLQEEHQDLTCHIKSEDS